MAEICDRSLPPFDASNAPVPDWTHAVARAGRRAAESADRAAALGAILDEMRAATGAERAFLVEAAPGGRRGRVVAATAAVLSEGISWSVAARALAGERALVLSDLAADGGTFDAVSVRALALRAAVAVPVPRPGGPRAAIVLDSRAPLSVDGRSWDAAARSFAAVASLVLRAVFERAEPAEGIPPRPALSGGSPAAARLRDDIALAAPLPLPVLVVGASGTGKELVARALHEGSPRRKAPWVAINCAAIPDTLLERELFGAVRGAYTGADRDHVGLFRQAGGGTLFLDEIGDMPPSLQAKILRVLQDRTVRPVGGLDEIPVDVRVIAATHRDLPRLVAEGRFRDDLRYRLAVLVVRVPTLAERGEDLRALSREILERLASRCAIPRPALRDDAVDALREHPWPGNVRELEAVLARALVRVRGGAIGRADLDFNPAGALGTAPPPEDAMIREALAGSRGNVTAAAASLGWTRQALYRRMHALRMLPPRGAGRRYDSGAT